MTPSRDGDEPTGRPVARTVASTPSALPAPGPRTDIASADTLLDPNAPEAPAPVAIGEVLAGRYRILSEVGRGGEGVVYRALDLRADSVVALKLLERGAAHLGRYRRELQMARKVTHPNAVRIHDLVDLPQRFGLSMEFVEGEALDQRIARGGPLSPKELVALARDLASALAAAHAAGVTHRDLKPANVLLRSDGSGAVVTDFGVARLHGSKDAPSLDAVASSRPGPMIPLTSEGALIGTPLYMAPEQLEGRTDIGPPADVYAFGLVLREAATGRRLHDDTTRVAELLEARRVRPPPLSRFRPELSAAFAAVLDRCLDPSDTERFADGRALLHALERTTAGRRTAWLSAGAAGALLLVAGVAFERARVAPGPAPPSAPPPTPAASLPAAPALGLVVEGQHRLTPGEGCEEFPSLFPDGQQIAYDATVGEDSYIFVRRVGEPSARAITHVAGWDLAPAVSPDGARVAFLRMAGAIEGVFVVDAQGGSEPRLVAPGRVRPTWSRDGKALWGGERTKPALFDAETGAVLRSVEIPAGSLAIRVTPSAAGDLVLMPGDREAGRAGLALEPGTGGPLRWLLEADVEEALAFTPDGRTALVSRSLVTRGMELVAVPLDGAPPVSLASSGIEARKGVEVSRDGRRIVWSTCASHAGVARVRRGKLEATPGGGEWDDVAVAPVGATDALAVLSGRSGPTEPWLVDRTGRSPPRPVAFDAPGQQDLDVSRDGAWLAVQTAAGLALAPVDGSAPARSVTQGTHDLTPRFSPLGDELYFARRLGDLSMQILAAPVAGGEPRVVLAMGARWPAPSPDGRRLAFLGGDDAAHLTPRVVDLATGQTQALSPELAPGAYEMIAWSPDGKRVALGRNAQEILEVDAATRHVLLDLRSGDGIGDMRYAGGELYVARYSWRGGVWAGDARWR